MRIRFIGFWVVIAALALILGTRQYVALRPAEFTLVSPTDVRSTTSPAASPSHASSSPIIASTTIANTSTRSAAPTFSDSNKTNLQNAVKSLHSILPPAPISLPVVPSGATSQLTSKEVYDKLAPTVIQLLCPFGQNLVATGSGFIVSEHGVVMTNAHVVGEAKTCFVRAGNPPVTIGKLEVLYVGDQTDKIPSTNVARQDFAFGKISTLLPSSPVTPPFKYLRLDATYIPLIQDGFYTASYPTELAGGSDNSILIYTTATVSALDRIDEIDMEWDVLEFPGNIATQLGFSGSPLVTPRDGGVVAMVFAQISGEESAPFGGPPQALETGKRIGLAFLVPYLDRVIHKTKGKSLVEFITELDAK